MSYVVSEMEILKIMESLNIWIKQFFIVLNRKDSFVFIMVKYRYALFLFDLSPTMK